MNSGASKGAYILHKKLLANKINSFSPGTHIPIVSVDYYKKNIPDYTFLFACNHKKEIFLKEKKILKKTKWFAHIKI